MKVGTLVQCVSTNKEIIGDPDLHGWRLEVLQ